MKVAQCTLMISNVHSEELNQLLLNRSSGMSSRTRIHSYSLPKRAISSSDGDATYGRHLRAEKWISNKACLRATQQATMDALCEIGQVSHVILIIDLRSTIYKGKLS